ncbi:MAG TPA: nuclear transport factor 2 family protein, partial [Calditrichia bacterium]|nr:nuclear transport factor 2 family protein [Calditrichia bacterium]
DRYLNRYDTAEKMGQLTFDDVHIRVLGRDTAIADGRWALGYPDRPGSEGRFTLLFQRIGGQWRIVYDHTSLKQAV